MHPVCWNIITQIVKKYVCHTLIPTILLYIYIICVCTYIYILYIYCSAKLYIYVCIYIYIYNLVKIYVNFFYLCWLHFAICIIHFAVNLYLYIGDHCKFFFLCLIKEIKYLHFIFCTSF